MNKYPKRKSIQLQKYDYSQPGYYYVTICTDKRKCIFGDIIDNNMNLNNAGKSVNQILETLPKHFPKILLDKYIVMPNHVHILIEIVGAGSSPPDQIVNNTINGRENRAPTLGKIIAYFKYDSTKQINNLKNNGINKIWQRNYYDHIIRNNKSLNNVREYIINNPATWATDEHNPNNKNHNIKTIEAIENLAVFNASS